MDEFELINKYFSKLSKNNKSALNLNDDVFFDKKKGIVISVDTYNIGTHFVNFKSPDLVINKVLRTSISDIICKGVKPKFYFISGSGFTPGSDSIPSFSSNPELYQRNFLSDKYGANYEIKLFENDGTQIFKTDSINWIFDYKTGVVQFMNSSVDPSDSDFVYMSGYQYVGNTLSTGLEITGNVSSSGYVLTNNVSASGEVIEDGDVVAYN